MEKKPFIMAGDEVVEGRPLTYKQRAFALAFLENGGNGQKAAEASYDTKNSNSARAMAPAVLANVSVRDEIQRLMVVSGLTATAVLGIHRRNMFQDTNLSVSQTAVKDYYHVAGVLKEDDPRNAPVTSFVKIENILNLTSSQLPVVEPLSPNIEHPESLTE